MFKNSYSQISQQITRRSYSTSGVVSELERFNPNSGGVDVLMRTKVTLCMKASME